eukprot:scaffold20566_cov135-Isochrysis_galbana.AAC.4
MASVRRFGGACVPPVARDHWRPRRRRSSTGPSEGPDDLVKEPYSRFLRFQRRGLTRLAVSAKELHSRVEVEVSSRLHTLR